MTSPESLVTKIVRATSMRSFEVDGLHELIDDLTNESVSVSDLVSVAKDFNPVDQAKVAYLITFLADAFHYVKGFKLDVAALSELNSDGQKATFFLNDTPLEEVFDVRVEQFNLSKGVDTQRIYLYVRTGSC